MRNGAGRSASARLEMLRSMSYLCIASLISASTPAVRVYATFCARCRGQKCPPGSSKCRTLGSAGSERCSEIVAVDVFQPAIENCRFHCCIVSGRLAQLVQSAALTRRRSLVRSQQRPRPASLTPVRSRSLPDSPARQPLINTVIRLSIRSIRS